MEGSPKLLITGIDDETTLACLARARTYEQFRRGVQDALSGNCPFCNLDREYCRVVLEHQLWRAWHCNPKEKNTKLHLIMSPVRHVKDSLEFSKEEKAGYWDIYHDICMRFQLQSRGILRRDGDARFSAGTIQHFHEHIMVPDGTGRVESPFYKGAAAELEGVLRAIVFEKIRCGASIVSLTNEERALIEGRV